MCKVSKRQCRSPDRDGEMAGEREGDTADPSESIISASMRLPSNPKKRKKIRQEKTLKKEYSATTNTHRKYKRHQNDWETAEKCCSLLLLLLCCCCCASLLLLLLPLVSCCCRALKVNPYKCAEDGLPRKSSGHASWQRMRHKKK